MTSESRIVQETNKGKPAARCSSIHHIARLNCVCCSPACTELVDEILNVLREKAAALDDDKWLYDKSTFKI